MKLLAFETAGIYLSACLWEDNRVRAEKTDRQHPEDAHGFMPLLHGLFRQARWAPQDIDAVVVDVGPGRFTGLRVGVSAARTLGQVLQKPVVEVSRLEALAAQGSGWQMGKSFVWKFPHDLLCVLQEAPGNDVHMAVWRFHKLTERSRRGLASGRSLHTFSHHFKLVHAPALFAFDRFLAFFQSCFQQQTLLFAGSGAQRYRRDLQKAFGSHARFAPAFPDTEARWVAALGAEKFFRREIKSFNQVQPLYLRPSYAEENALKAAANNGKV